MDIATITYHVQRKIITEVISIVGAHADQSKIFYSSKEEQAEDSTPKFEHPPDQRLHSYQKK